MINKKFMFLFAVLVLFVMLSGCADAIHYDYSRDIHQVGFWYGLWHGIISPVSFIISLFDSKVAIYAVYNNGAWYNLGFLLGACISLGGSGSATKRKKRF